MERKLAMLSQLPQQFISWLITSSSLIALCTSKPKIAPSCCCCCCCCYCWVVVLQAHRLGAQNGWKRQRISPLAWPACWRAGSQHLQRCYWDSPRLKSEIWTGQGVRPHSCGPSPLCLSGLSPQVSGTCTCIFKVLLKFTPWPFFCLEVTRVYSWLQHV